MPVRAVLWPVDLCRGFRCPKQACDGICFMPGGTTCFDDDAAMASLPCGTCGATLSRHELQAALDYEAQYGFVVEYGTMQQDVQTARGLFAGAGAVFKQHWILLFILQALCSHHQCGYGAETASKLSMHQESAASLRVAMIEPWPWIFR